MKRMEIKKQKSEPIYTRFKNKNPIKASTISSTCLDETTVERVFKSYQGIKNIDFQVRETIDLKITEA